MRKKYLIYSIFALSVAALYSQTGVNTNSPNKHTALDVRNETDERGNIAKHKGISLPAVNKSIRNNQSNFPAASLPDGILLYNKPDQHFDYFDANIRRWRCLAGIHRAQAAFDCDDVVISGVYDVANPLNLSNYMTIPFNVAEIGDYEIKAVAFKNGTTVPNGYYFYAKGKFLTTGNICVPVAGVGKPAETSAAPDRINIYFNGELLCSAEIAVEDNRLAANYQIVSVTLNELNAKYVVNRNLVPTTNYITCVTAPVEAASAGAEYEIASNTVNGYHFYAKGVLKPGVNVIQLHGSGAPLLPVSWDYSNPHEPRKIKDRFSITTNSSNPQPFASQGIDQLDIQVAYRHVNILTFGYDRYSGGDNAKTLLARADLFAPDQLAYYPVNGISYENYSENAQTPNTNVQNTENFINCFNSGKYEIIILAWDFYLTVATGTSNNNNRAIAIVEAIRNYVNRGGLYLHTTQASHGENQYRGDNMIFNALFDDMNIKSVTSGGGNSTADRLYDFGNSSSIGGLSAYAGKIQNQEHAIVKGPFGYLAGEHCYHDYAGDEVAIKTDLLSNAPDFVRLSSVYNPGNNSSSITEKEGYTYAFTHKTKKFVYFGDAGAFDGYRTDGLMVRPDVALPPGIDVITSRNTNIYLNILAWAIEDISRNYPNGIGTVIP